MRGLWFSELVSFYPTASSSFGLQTTAMTDKALLMNAGAESLFLFRAARD